MKTTIQWKFLEMVDGNIRSKHGDCVWKIGKWQKPIKELDICNAGYHSSPDIVEAYSWVNGTILAQVECKGKHVDITTKSVWENMRITKAWMWTNEARVALIRKCTELHLEKYQDDNLAKQALIDFNEESQTPLYYWCGTMYDGTYDVNKWLKEEILPTLEEITNG
jgi:hypothetical protein